MTQNGSIALMKINLPLFIVFEGIDGSGKTTLSNLLYDELLKDGVPVIKNREPTDGRWGKKIRKILQTEGAKPETLLKLFLSDREDDVKTNILPALQSKKLIITDRYYFSNAAYQGAMGISPDLIIDENRSRKFPEPDRIYLLDITPDTALDRISIRNSGSNREIFEKKDFLTRVKNIYHSIADKRFIILNGSLKPEENIKIIKKDISENFC